MRAGGASRGLEHLTSGPRLRERDHAADAVLGLHQLEATVDLVKREPVREERLDVDLAREPAVDEERHLAAPLDTAEGGAGDPVHLDRYGNGGELDADHADGLTRPGAAEVGVTQWLDVDGGVARFSLQKRR